MDQKRFTVADLFCGAGGLSLGLKEAGFETLYAFDWDAAAIATYREFDTPAWPTSIIYFGPPEY